MACIIIWLWNSLAPLLSGNELGQLTLTHTDLGKGIRYVSNKVWVESKQIIRQNGTGKYTMKALAFCP